MGPKVLKGRLDYHYRETLLQNGSCQKAGLIAWGKPIVWQMGISTFVGIILAFLRDRNHHRKIFTLQYPTRDYSKKI